MIQKICIILMIGLPLTKLGASIAKTYYKEDEKSAGYVAAILVSILTYLVYYYAGVFSLL